MFKEIAIYSDLGVDQLSLEHLIKSINEAGETKITFLKAKDINEKNWQKKTSLLIFPGGRDLPYLQLLKEKGIDLISNYIKEGGSYLGICAGAYFGASHIEFEKGSPLEVCGPRPLSFFPGFAKGPAYGHNRYRYDSHQGVEAALIDWKGKKFRSYFNGGCFFEKAEEFNSVKVLSRYNEVEGTPAAIISCKVEKGLAVLTGVHIECSTSFFTPTNTYLEQIFPKLQKDENFRREVFAEILNFLTKRSNIC